VGNAVTEVGEIFDYQIFDHIRLKDVADSEFQNVFSQGYEVVES
jgi:hypothetical protein